ncbi:MAG: helix-turn-helix domain-containing protein [Burkholderiales bacterium]|nr:helix-turn-helix domain-containing protein [Burkholderiales bacterium]
MILSQKSLQKIKSLRKRARIGQAVLAAVLNTSLSTVQKWEGGDKQPSGPSLKLLNGRLEKHGICHSGEHWSPAKSMN